MAARTSKETEAKEDVALLILLALDLIWIAVLAYSLTQLNLY